MSIKRIVIYVSIIVSVLSVVSCKEDFPTLEDFAEYSKYLENGDLEGVKKYYKKFGPRSVEQYGVEGLFMINPLEGSLYYNHYDIAEFLLKKGANPDAISPTMHTPIIFNCIVNNNIKGLELLIKYNADVSVFNDSDGCSTLWYAAATGVEILDIIYKRTKDINVKNKDKATALFGAVIMGRFDYVKFLIDHEIDVNAINSIGCSALMYAVNIGRIDICEYLIEHEADISIVDNEGYDAKWIADELGLQIKGLTY
ncbi:ankyrin repeat domain-containing protein [Treponema sp. Marseille-Q4132]|uniref:ankyrin repeat domain-containing protein n=1 Tax=Treponema sp. Marseille-Q4132 TaxID=2766701 RepID=UPI001652F65B|nr:ankyrin repeat domain-containing protein [Treponema sp. Marseille-Q4132]QNL97979.1 ankyrin repeat domain-containing protein [Treponema sp. Marseille-Q4132]